MDKEYNKAYTEGYYEGMVLGHKMIETLAKKYFFVRKWMWILFMIVSFVESTVLIWHILKDK